MLLWIALGFVLLWVVGYIIIGFTAFLIHIALIIAIILVVAHFLGARRR
jgi:hypothetical protein